MKVTEEIKQALQALADANDNRLTVDLVIASARDENSPLNASFDWDVEKAAMNHWRDTARRLIRKVTIEYKVEKTIVEAVSYIRDPRCDPLKQGYVSVSSIRTDEEVAHEALVMEFARVRTLLDRAHGLAKVLGMEADFKILMAQVKKINATLELRGR